MVHHLVHGRLAQVHTGRALAVMSLDLLGGEGLLWGKQLILMHIVIRLAAILVVGLLIYRVANNTSLTGESFDYVLAHLAQSNQGLGRDELIGIPSPFFVLWEIIRPGGRNGKTALVLVAKNER